MKRIISVLVVAVLVVLLPACAQQPVDDSVVTELQAQLDAAQAALAEARAAGDNSADVAALEAELADAEAALADAGSRRSSVSRRTRR